MAEYEAKGDKYTWVVSSWDAGLSIYCVFIKKSFNLQRPSSFGNPIGTLKRFTAFIDSVFKVRIKNYYCYSILTIYPYCCSKKPGRSTQA